MRDSEYFQKLAVNIVMWGVIAVILVVVAAVVFLPLILATLVDWRFIFLYLAYFAALILLVVIKGSGGN
jgi:hypothetical protein